jgi:Na+/proline symporter
MGWLYVFMGVIISSAVLPATLTLMWKGQNKWAATLSPVLGLCCSIIAWLVTTSKLNDGVITVATSGANNPMLAGNVVALLSPVIFIPVLTLIFGVGKSAIYLSAARMLTSLKTTTTGCQ